MIMDGELDFVSNISDDNGETFVPVGTAGFRRRNVENETVSLASFEHDYEAKKTNGDDVLTRDEFYEILVCVRKQAFTHKGVQAKLLFNRWDKDGDGFLDYDELREKMQQVVPGFQDQSKNSSSFSPTWTRIETTGSQSWNSRTSCIRNRRGLRARQTR